jgi:hypothetical protein
MPLTDAETNQCLLLAVRGLRALATHQTAEAQQAAAELGALIEATTGEPIETGDALDTIAELERLIESDD